MHLRSNRACHNGTFHNANGPVPQLGPRKPPGTGLGGSWSAMASGFWDVTGDEVIVSSSMQPGSIGNRLARSEKFNFLVGPDRPILPAVLLADPVRHSGVPRQRSPAAGG